MAHPGDFWKLVPCPHAKGSAERNRDCWGNVNPYYMRPDPPPRTSLLGKAADKAKRLYSDLA